MTDLDATTLRDRLRQPAPTGDPGPGAGRGDRRARTARWSGCSASTTAASSPTATWRAGRRRAGRADRPAGASFPGAGRVGGVEAHGHDEPADLRGPAARRRLRAGGPGDRRGRAGRAAGRRAPVLPEGVRLREVTARADLERIAAHGGGGLAARTAATWSTGLAREIDGRPAVDHRRGGRGGRRRWSAPAGCAIPAAPASPRLWGGSTLPQWRRRGIYRALVAYRARLAEPAGPDAAAGGRLATDSRPILERLGLVAVTTTTPYVYTP